ncbi:MAG: DUF4301 family protein [Alphaproteobacteria bacterium]|nr:DUF4301 family protein [Alphaproteobacteria bacterium]
MTFTENDKKQISSHNLTTADIEQQLNMFKQGFPYIDIVKPATTADGVKKITNQEINTYISAYKKYSLSHKIVKFVPASGAATRMFKDLFSFIETDIMNKTTEIFLQNIKSFAFWDDLLATLPENYSDKDICIHLLKEIGLNYGSKPKGLLKFHKYSQFSLTPIEEHLIEGVKYASSNGIVNIHFTVSPEHKSAFLNLLNKVIPEYENKYNVKYNIELSEQNSATDTIAVNMDNTLFRDKDNSLLFRPSGHGALINNLNQIDADIIFIKNIDNNKKKKNIENTSKYKKLLAGILIDTQTKIFNYLSDIDSNTANITEIHNFINSSLGIKLTEKKIIQEYYNILNRPIRVCGVVKNIGAPGGGPFWVKSNDNTIFLQIVESSQISPDNLDIMNKSEYFNPVDIVCGTKDYKNQPFDLQQYIDINTSFISVKSKNGISIRAMERPGLWNGAMAKWNTIFVEVPQSTFSPVKTVIDLLSQEHKN